MNINWQALSSISTTAAVLLSLWLSTRDLRDLRSERFKRVIEEVKRIQRCFYGDGNEILIRPGKKEEIGKIRTDMENCLNEILVYFPFSVYLKMKQLIECYYRIIDELERQGSSRMGQMNSDYLRIHGLHLEILGKMQAKILPWTQRLRLKFYNRTLKGRKISDTAGEISNDEINLFPKKLADGHRPGDR